MEDIAQQASKNVDRTEKDVLAALSLKEPAYSGLESQLAKFRSACQDFVFIDFRAAAEKKTESRLWEAHSRVNKKFRPFLAKFRESDGKKKHVERRKAEKLYLEFIKSSMRFYRGYIQRLASQFSDVPEILEIARKFNLDTLSADTPQPAGDAHKKQIVRSCYLTLVQLGDLSRYRETEVQTKERNWGPAKGYYNLATALDPSSGMSYNQLAVIALTDQDHLRAVYYLYRAICVENPAPQAQANLELEFKKVRTRAEQGKSISNQDMAAEGSRDLQNRFILFHARFWEKSFVGHEDQQSEMLRLLADELRERPFDTTIRKYCLINIAAEESAGNRVRDNPSALQSFEIAQALNVGVFFTLLKLLLDELQQLAKDTDDHPSDIADGRSRVTSVTRRILPHLRLYSGWLLSTVRFLLANTSLTIQIKELWQVYAEALSLLMHTFSIRDLPEIQYLLDEDRDTLAFAPFSIFVRGKRFQDAQGQTKPSHSDASFGPQSSENEMLYRIKGLVRDGVYLCKKVGEFGPLPIPLVFAGNRFVFYEGDVLPADDHTTTPPIHAHTASEAGISRDDIEYAKQTKKAVEQVVNFHETASDTGMSGSMASTMENMVNNLTAAPDQASNAPDVLYSPLTPTLRTPAGGGSQLRPQPSAITARDFVQQIHNSSNSVTPGSRDNATNLPTLPPIWNTPFTPRLGETPESSPRPNTARRLVDSSVANPHLNSPAQFQADILRMQQQIQMRTSPQALFEPTMSSHYETPTNLTSWIRANDQIQPQPSPWPSLFNAAPAQESLAATRSSHPSPYGAIGEPLRKANQTPTSGQPG